MSLGDLNAPDPAPIIFLCFFLTVTGWDKKVDFNFFERYNLLA
jgi:hypothetical protein